MTTGIFLCFCAFEGTNWTFLKAPMLKMDWESKFGSIVRETESNLAKVKVRVQCKYNMLCVLS